MMIRSFCTALLASALCLSAASAQWGTKWLQDDAYWGDGKAEFNVYEAREMRYGQPRPSYILHILMRESFAAEEMVAAADPKATGAYSVIKMNQVLYVPTGLHGFQQMLSLFWKPNTGQLLKATLTSSDGIGNTYKELTALAGWRAWMGGGWRYHWHTYQQGTSEGTETVRGEKDAIFYDELPMRVRTIDFTAGEGTFAIPVAGSLISSEKGEISFAPYTISWRQKSVQPEDNSGDKLLGPITVRVKPRDGDAEDVFILDSHPPYTLREWRKADGGTLKLKHSFKIDYWNYNKIGDMEKLLTPPPNSAPPEEKTEDAEKSPDETEVLPDVDR
jgi:hypothetical protein